MASMTSKELIRLLKKNGWSESHQSGSHVMLTKGGQKIAVPLHNRNLPTGTLEKLLKQSGLK